MDASITNISTEVIFIPGPYLDIPAGETKVWAGVLMTDLNANTVVKQAIIDGKITLSLVPDALDAPFAASAPAYAVADLPTGVDGATAFATDGRAGAEGAAAGTGTMVVFSNSNWRRVEDLAIVAA
jgi:hypothetical protein